MGLLGDKVALITGAAAGIGRAAALTFSREGAAVVVADRDGDGAEQTAALVRDQGGVALAVTADITRLDDVRAMVRAALDAHGRLDCAFNNAGVSGPLHPIVGYPGDAFQQVMDVNVKGVFQCLQEELPVLTEATGAIVNASSGLGTVGAPALSAYVASKHAVMGLTRTAALEVAARGIRVNAVLPGVVATSMPVRLTEGAPEVMELFKTQTPMGRLARPEEIAEAAAWLCSDRSSFVTGHGLVVDGGIVAA
jgi:NAD(P)-dependent dehydrogenase (short-subunit alcohol dehydrogenase family)